MTSTSDDCALYHHQIKTPISFLCRQGLNSRFLIQLSKTLPVKQTETYKYYKSKSVFSVMLFKNFK